MGNENEPSILPFSLSLRPGSVQIPPFGIYVNPWCPHAHSPPEFQYICGGRRSRQEIQFSCLVHLLSLSLSLSFPSPTPATRFKFLIFSLIPPQSKALFFSSFFSDLGKKGGKTLLCPLFFFSFSPFSFVSPFCGRVGGEAGKTSFLF